MHFAELTSRGARILGAAALLMTMLTAPAFAQAPPAPTEKKTDESDAKKKILEALSLYGQAAAAQPQPGDDKKVDPADVRKRATAALADYFGKVVAEQPGQPAPDPSKLRDELHNLEIELQRKMAESEQLRAKIEIARQHMKAAEAAAKEEKTARVVLVLDDAKGSEEITLRRVNGVWQVVPHDGKVGVQVTPVPKKPGAPASGGFGAAPKLPPPAPVPPPAGAGQPPSLPAKPMPPAPPEALPPGGGADGRIENLERKLDKMMQLLDQMRKEMDAPRKKAGPEEEARARKAEDAARAQRDGADAAERKVIQDRIKAAQDELLRVEELRRALEDAKRKAEDAQRKGDKKVENR